MREEEGPEVVRGLWSVSEGVECSSPGRRQTLRKEDDEEV